MTSSPSSPKRTVKSYFEEISTFDLYHQLTYMSATSAAGITRARVFELARTLRNPTAQYFEGIHDVAEQLRYNYPDAVRLIGETTKSEETKTFLLRLSDALRSGEPLPGFLAREAQVMGEQFENDYVRRLESLKKWTDAYTAIIVSAALIVIINMVSSMIYNLGLGLMLMMVMVAIAAGFGVAWVLFRTAPADNISVPLKRGNQDQQRSRKLFMILAPLALVVCVGLALAGLDKAWVFIAAGLFMAPIGLAANRADKQVREKDVEISSFLRSLGGTATSRGTTLKEALASTKIDSFPTLQPDIRMLDLRLKSFGRPRLCWEMFGLETGSQLANQSVGIFFDAINLGGDPERSGNLTSAFSLKAAMLRAQRRGISATFMWLTLVMHFILSGLMVFLLGILEQFAIRLDAAMAELGEGVTAQSEMGLSNMFAFNTPQLQFLSTITVGMIFMLAIINAFAIVGSEGAHVIKITFFLFWLFVLSGICFLVVPPLAAAVV